MRTQLLVLVAAGSILFGSGAATLVGCSSSSAAYHPPASQLKEGVNLLDVKDPAWGTNSAFMQAGRVVYVETRVGAPKPDVYRQSWPEDPPNEMDLRLVDQNGNTFYVMRGGDSLIDPTWAAEMSKTYAANKLVPKSERDQDWQLAQVGAKAVAAALPSGFQDHAFHLNNFAAQQTPANNPFMQAKEARIAATPLPASEAGEKAYGTLNYGNYSWLETDKYSSTTSCFAWVCAARHSATYMWDCEWNGSSCSWVLAVNANNHGRDASQLGYDCYSNGGWYMNTTVNGSTAGGATGSNDGQGGCQSAYSWSSNNNAHLCNDDAAYELWQAKSGGTNTSYGNQYNFWWGTSEGASGYGSLTTSVGDFSCNYPSGDWNSPNCP